MRTGNTERTQGRDVGRERETLASSYKAILKLRLLKSSFCASVHFFLLSSTKSPLLRLAVCPTLSPLFSFRLASSIFCGLSACFLYQPIHTMSGLLAVFFFPPIYLLCVCLNCVIFYSHLVPSPPRSVLIAKRAYLSKWFSLWLSQSYSHHRVQAPVLHGTGKMWVFKVNE